MAGDRLYDDPALVRFYDFDNGWGPDLDFCLRLAEEAGSILDLGCGTGLFFARAGQGRRAVGLDPAAAMLAIARRQPGGERVTWVEGDARDARLGQHFDLIVLTGHAFQVFLTEADQGAALATIAAHLAPGGCFVLDSRNPAAEEWREWTPQASRRRLDDPELGPVEAWNEAAMDAATGVVTYETHYRAEATGQVFSAASRIRFTLRDRLAALIAGAGLAVDDWLGGWDGRPWTPDAPEIIPLGRLR